MKLYMYTIAIMSLLSSCANMENVIYVYNDELEFVTNYKGNRYVNGRFLNGDEYEKAPIWSVVKWKLSKNPQREEKKSDTFSLRVDSINPQTIQDFSITWLGHASFLINIDGTKLITDPCLYDLPTSKREVALPCDINMITGLDYMLVSHDHHDHFQKKSVMPLVKNNPDIKVLLPLHGNKLFKAKELEGLKTQEAGWYQEYKIKDDLRIIFLPAKHWGRRGLTDFNNVLWGSFLIISDNYKIYFAGDTGYDNHFKRVNELFGKIDICILPIGAYSPADLMSSSHMTPEEAYKAFADLEGDVFVPMHYGTYDLSDEPLGEPIKRLSQCFSEQKHDKKLKTLNVGEVFNFNK